jgi:hypothetical protein
MMDCSCFLRNNPQVMHTYTQKHTHTWSIQTQIHIHTYTEARIAWSIMWIGYGSDDRGIVTRARTFFFSFLFTVDRKKSDWDRKLTTELHLMPRLRLRGSIFILPHMPLWSAQGQLSHIYTHYMHTLHTYLPYININIHPEYNILV